MANYRSIFRKHNERPYFCYFCGEEIIQGQGKHDVHHKSHNRKNNRPKNLVAVHKNCHVYYHRQITHLYWFEKLRIYLFDKMPSWVDFEPESERLARWAAGKYNWRDPERLRHLAKLVGKQKADKATYGLVGVGDHFDHRYVKLGEGYDENEHPYPSIWMRMPKVDHEAIGSPTQALVTVIPLPIESEDDEPAD